MKESIITSSNINKDFITYIKEPGIIGTLKSFVKRNKILKKAVDNFSLDIKEQEIVGLVGPNGAGKTTFMKMLSGIIIPTSGILNVLGYAPYQRLKIFRKQISLVMGQKSQLWWDIPAMDSFLLLQRFYEIPEDIFKKRLNHMTEILSVKHLLKIHVRKLSLGERMKMELVASLLHSPKLILLDEPTIGLDLISQENIRQFIKDYQKSNKCAIIVTSHYMADVHALCSRLVLMLNGKKSYDGPLNRFEKLLGNSKVVHFNFAIPIEYSDDLWKKYDAKWQNDYTQVELRIPDSDLREISSSIIKNYPVTHFGTEKMPIERVIKTLMNNPKLIKNIKDG